MDKKILVTYFSATGRTKAKAELIAQITNSDLFEIKPESLYTREDLNWNNKNSRCSIEHKNKIYPKISDKIKKFEEYDIIFIGYPIWWWSAPNIVKQFVSEYDFTNKVIIPFATSGGDFFGSDGKCLHKFASKDAKWKKGKLLNLKDKEKIEKWIKSCNVF